MEYLFVLAAGFSALFLLIIIGNKKKRTEHWILATMFFFIMISCYYVFQLYHHDGVYYEPVFSEINYAIPLLYGVLLYFYTKSLITRDYRMKWEDFIHLIPFFMFLGFLFYPLINGQKTDAAAQLGYPLIKLVINPIYIFLTLNLLRQHRKALLEQYSFIDQMHHYWLNWVAYGGLLLWICACLGNVFNWYNDYNTQMLGDYFLIGFLAVLMFIIAYVGFNRTQIFQSVEAPEQIQLKPIEANPNAKEDNNYNEEYLELQETMSSKKPFLDHNLSLSKLARVTELSPSKLSTIINQMGGKNFYDFVNAYRVEAVKERLLSGDLDKYSILGIAEECGFNSKASFNRIFKKQAGMTPSEFAKTQSSKS